jgi:hypothetical protein
MPVRAGDPAPSCRIVGLIGGAAHGRLASKRLINALP